MWFISVGSCYPHGNFKDGGPAATSGERLLIQDTVFTPFKFGRLHFDAQAHIITWEYNQQLDSYVI
jgi:hypothetical protein